MKAQNNVSFFLFNFFLFFHNNNGGFMKKIIFLFLFLTYSVNAQSIIYVSKKDIDTNSFVSDCDFTIYDSLGNIVDSWIQDNSVHTSFLDLGKYKLVERDLMSDYLSSQYSFDVNDDIVELTLYNQKIETPKNLGINNNYCLIFILFGFVIIIYSRKFCRL